MMVSRRAVPLVLAFAIGLSACENSLGPDSVRSVEIDIDRTTLIEGENTSIGVAASDIDGGSISGSEVTWISRDPTTVRVEDGSLIAIAPGVASIIADVRGARDSVRIRVRFANLARGNIGVRLQGAEGVRNHSTGITIMVRGLALDGTPTFPNHTSIQTRLGDRPAPTGGTGDAIFADADTLVSVMLNRPPVVGARQFDGYEPDTLNGTFILRGAEGAMVRIIDRSDPLRSEVYTPVGMVDLEIDEVVLPDTPGFTGGTLRGSVAFEAAGLVMRLDTANHRVSIEGAASDTTLPVYVEFETDLYEWLTGMARLEVTKGDATVSHFSSTTAHFADGGVDLLLGSAIPDLADPTDRLLLTTRIAATGPGTIPVDQLDGDTFDLRTGAPGTWSYVRIYPADSPSLDDDHISGYGYSIGDHITLSEYRAPTGTLFGMIRGTYEITYALRDENNEPTGETVESSAEFVMPIRPTCFPSDPDCS